MKHWACGYWYRGRSEEGEEEDWPSSCWMPSLDFHEQKLFFVAAGNWHPSPIAFMEYDINANVWTMLHWENQECTRDDAGPVIRASDQVGQAKFVDGWKAFWAYKVDATGPIFNESYANAGYGLWVLKDGEDVVYSEFLDAEKELTEDCAGKMDIDDTGRIVIMYTLSATGETVVKYSDDYGVTFSIVRTLADEAARLDYGILIDDNGDIIICYQSSSTSVKYEMSTDNGASWSSAVTQVVGSNIERIVFTKSDDFLWCVAKGDEVRIYRTTRTTFADTLQATVDATSAHFRARGRYDLVKTYQNDDSDERFFHYGGTVDGWTEGIGDSDEGDFSGAVYLSFADYQGSFAMNDYWYGYSNFNLRNYTDPYSEFEETEYLSLLASMDGKKWKIITTPLNWAYHYEDVQKDVVPVWPFKIQRNKPIAGWDWSKI